jgi:hypothetical protein
MRNHTLTAAEHIFHLEDEFFKKEPAHAKKKKKKLINILYYI